MRRIITTSILNSKRVTGLIYLRRSNLLRGQQYLNDLIYIVSFRAVSMHRTETEIFEHDKLNNYSKLTPPYLNRVFFACPIVVS